jgi:hypothetical protein
LHKVPIMRIRFQTFICTCGFELRATVGDKPEIGAFGQVNDAQWRKMCLSQGDSPKHCAYLRAAIRHQTQATEELNNGDELYATTPTS